MNFKKYPSIENSYRDKYIDRWLQHYPELQLEDYIIVEKIHGANFQVLLSQNKIQFASRNMMLSDDVKFFGFQDVMDKYSNEFSTIQEFMKSEDIESIRLFGELFGSNIQKGVDYGKEKKYRVFDIYVEEDLLSQSDAMFLLEHLDLKHIFVPIMDIAKGLDKALEFNTEFNSTLSSLVEDNMCEGVVIKPLNKVYCYDDKSPFYLKKKNKSFSEKQKSKGTGRDTPSSQFVKVQNIFAGHINKNRLDSVFSKHGEIESPKEIGKYIKLVLEDAKEDFLKDYMDEFNTLENKEKSGIFSITGRILVPMIEQYL